MGDDSKRAAAKAFVDNYFPMKKQQQPKSLCDVLDQVIPPNSSQESSKNQASADGNKKKPGKGVSAPQKGSSTVIICDNDSDPSLMSLGVNYGARDYYYPCPQASLSSSGNSHEVSDEKHVKQKGKKDAYDYTAPENSRGEWWQGSYDY